MCDFSHCCDDLAEDDIIFSFMTHVFLLQGADVSKGEASTSREQHEDEGGRGRRGMTFP